MPFAITSRAIIGTFFQRLEADLGQSWIPGVSMEFNSNQESETYKWLGMTPQMREWIGGRLAKGLRETGMTITNKVFESTLEVLLDDIRRDKTGQIMIRVGELADRANLHWVKLLLDLIVANGLCYDGKAFFATDHAEVDSGAQNNAITVNVATPAAPTAAEAEAAVLAGIQALAGFKDDQGEPLNELARQFLVMFPLNMMAAGMSALSLPVITDGTGTRSALISNMNGFSVRPAFTPRLTATDTMYVFRTDGQVKPFIRQNEVEIDVAAVAEGSEEEFKNRRWLFGVTAVRNVGYGYWQHAVKVQLT